MSVLTRQRWNEIVRAINELGANPPGGCQAIEPLEEVPESHRWSRADIRAAQDKLREICSENEFGEIPRLWKQSIVDELQAAIERGWCNCDCPSTIDYEWWRGQDMGLTTWTGPYSDLIRMSFGPSCTGTLTWKLVRSDGELVAIIPAAVVNGEIVNGDRTINFVYHGGFDHTAIETFE
jgi:hypothetical protein